MIASFHDLFTSICLLACLPWLTTLALIVQHESHELSHWLTSKKASALQQLKHLLRVLEAAQIQAAESANRASSHNHNVEMLAQKEQQYTQQLQNLEHKLTSVNYSPLVGASDCNSSKKG